VTLEDDEATRALSAWLEVEPERLDRRELEVT
jgi:hypothetical protein